MYVRHVDFLKQSSKGLNMKMRSLLIISITFIAGVFVAFAIPVVAQQPDSDSFWEVSISRPAVANQTIEIVHIVRLNKNTGQTMVLSCQNFCTKKMNWLELPTLVVK